LSLSESTLCEQRKSVTEQRYWAPSRACDTAGVPDMFQNHLPQLLALVAGAAVVQRRRNPQ
jgi:glucose-6-phosphate 1-dehydrogenase